MRQLLSLVKIIHLYTIFYYSITLDAALNKLQPANSPQLALITTGLSQKSKVHNRLLPTVFDTDYSNKINVRVNDILNKHAAAIAANSKTVRNNFSQNMQSDVLQNPHRFAQIVVKSHPEQLTTVAMTPTDDSIEFERVDVRVLGERIDNKALLQLRPSGSSASVRKLRRILGSDFQFEWMSINPPHTSGSSSGKSTRSALTSRIPKPDERLLAVVNDLNFTIMRPSQTDGMIFPVELMSDQVEIIKVWLLQRATCNMEFIWEDLGPLFWPRWIRRGVCVNTQSCSWPPGMRCRPSGSRTLTLLRWVCKNENLNDRLFRHKRREYDTKSTVAHRRYQRTVDGRRSRRVRRLIRKLSLTANGYHCEWNRYEYMVSEQCACGCEQPINSN